MIEHNHRWMEGDDELKRKIKQAIDHIRLTLAPEFPGVSVYWHGAVGIDPRHLGIWVTVESDADRDAILSDGTLNELVRHALRLSAYPKEAIPDIAGEVESQETVDREHGGRWYDRMR